MQLITSPEKNTCVAASLAMVTRLPLDNIMEDLFTNLYYPFPEPWAHLPKVPSMEVICDWAWKFHKISFIHFPRDPYCSPHKDCKSVPSWYNGEEKFLEQLSYGEGLLEGLSNGVGHMCAWDGDKVFDPRGLCYPFDKCDFCKFEPTRFWLCI